MGAGSSGGGVAGRDGKGDDGRDEVRGGGLGGSADVGVFVSRVGVGGSRRCMRDEKNPDIRLEARF